MIFSKKYLKLGINVLIFSTVVSIFFDSCAFDDLADAEGMNLEVKDQEELSPSKFKNQAQSGKIVDVRTHEEWQNGIIDGAKCVDFLKGNFVSKMDSIFGQDKSQKLYLYCQSGNRSFKALKLLKSNGFKNVYHLNGGLKAFNFFEEDQ